MKKFIFIGILIYGATLNAGLIGNAIKEKAFDKAKDIGTDIYKAKKEIRRDNETKMGNKSTLSKVEDKVDAAKQKIDNVKKTVVETGKQTVGKENLEYLKRVKNNYKETLIGKPIN